MRISVRFFAILAGLALSQLEDADAQVSASIMSPGNNFIFTKTPTNFSKFTVNVNVVGQFGNSPDSVLVRINDSSGTTRVWGGGSITYPSFLSYDGTATVDVYVPSLLGNYTLLVDLYQGNGLQLQGADAIAITIQ